jgi:NAD(P)-dependent dehydrogenase (short-subunit alcohol dehydrogenase family)
MRLNKKIALVTGGGSGIGRQTALLFAKEGAKVTIVDVNEKGGRHVVREIMDGGGDAYFIKGDVSISSDVRRIVKSHMKHYGNLDALLNIAGIQVKGSVLTTSEDAWDKVMDVNVKGIYLMSRETIPILAKRKGSITNMSSAFGFHAPPDLAVYSVSKAAVIQLTKVMAVDHGASGVRVNCICPGAIATPMMASNNSKAEIRRREETLPLRRIGSPIEVANVALFLASDEASFVTGAPYIVDGGSLAM